MTIAATSLEAYNYILSKGLLNEKQLRVYQIFMEYGDMTGAQVSEIYRAKYPSSSHSETIRNRITELVKAGSLRENGTTVCEYSHRTVTLYTLTTAIPSKEKNKELSKGQKIEYALEKIEQAASLINNEKAKNKLRVAWKLINSLQNN